MNLNSILIKGLLFQSHMDQGQVTIQTLRQMINHDQEYFKFEQAQITKAFGNLAWLTQILKHSS